MKAGFVVYTGFILLFCIFGTNLSKGEYPRYAELLEGVAGDGVKAVLRHHT